MKQLTKAEFRELVKEVVKDMVKGAPLDVGLAIALTGAKFTAKLEEEIFDDDEVIEIVKE